MRYIASDTLSAPRAGSNKLFHVGAVRWVVARSSSTTGALLANRLVSGHSWTE